MRHLSLRSLASGFSLIELMIAMTLGLLITAAIGSLFVGSRESYKQDEAATRMQDELRYAMAQITRDVEMAGFWTEFHDPAIVVAVPAPAIGTDCGPSVGTPWAYANLNEPLSAGDNLTTPAGAFSCITASSFVAGTDVLALKRVAGREATAAELADPDNANRAYLVSNCTQGVLVQGPAATGGLAGFPCPLRRFEYQPSVYHIRNYSAVAGDGIPTLCRDYLDGSPSMTAECFASGIENLQVEYGIDTDADPDGVPNTFVSAPTAAQLARVCAVRISLLVRSENQDFGYNTAKTFSLGNVTVTPSGNDKHYYRRVASAVALVRNPAALYQLQ